MGCTDGGGWVDVAAKLPSGSRSGCGNSHIFAMKPS